MPDEELVSAKERVGIQMAVAKELKRPEVSQAFRNKEMLIERQKSYTRFYKGWGALVFEILRHLKKGWITNPTERIAAWRLCTDWEIKERKFIEENEHLLEESVKEVKDEFLKDEFDALPLEDSDRIMLEFQKRKNAVFHWLAEEIRASYAKNKKEEK